ncbi:WD40 repeat domain-containing protein [Catenulispora acidiphila]|nr:WD40 repeat domain-containing protein [Catenulispora acidiphila]
MGEFEVGGLLQLMRGADPADPGTWAGWRGGWEELVDEFLDEGALDDGAYVVIPQVIDAAVGLAPEHMVDFWIRLGYAVAAPDSGAVPADLAAGYVAALRRAEQAVVRVLAAADVPFTRCTDLVLSGVAFSGHRIGRALWAISDVLSDHVLHCPGCDWECDYSTVVPGLPSRAEGHMWTESGIPLDASPQAVLAMAASLVATKGTPTWAAEEAAEQLSVLMGCFQCAHCGNTWSIADSLAPPPDGARPLDPDSLVVLDTPVPAGQPVSPTEETAMMAVTALLGCDAGVNAVAIVAGSDRPTLVVGGGDRGLIHVWDMATGQALREPLAGHPDRILTLAAIPKPDGGAWLASGGEGGSIGLWDPWTGEKIRQPEVTWAGGVSGVCAATMPDGRVLLASARTRGAVRVSEPVSGDIRARLNPFGHPIASIAPLPVAAGYTTIAGTDQSGRVYVWDPSISDPHECEHGAALAPSKDGLADAGHTFVQAVAAVPLRGKTLLATGDRKGNLALWDPATGTATGQTLPSDVKGRTLSALTATELPDGRTLVITGSTQGSTLRWWEPETGAVSTIDVGAAVTSLAVTGSTLVVGHTRGVFIMQLA